ncbi:septum site-determining protein MinD [Thermobrachium celere]|uniref:Septum site-determining protein MinD n=1 Tax=Thermobrachium celere DSM 8682 TaxID=941824 RepID=R7RRX3_9CLOT|nr:septum site-determining protein MinD [Thermobrachium celere]GFR36537.1 site-determining protein [Thermobrachium celere]CDF58121.1 Septum site-determining protein MinD [Thermobrachium celere DSM 8682]
MGVAIVVTSGKGGVGKTTTTANIGTALAMMGQKVVVVDADTGLRNLDLHLGLENRIVYNLVDVVEGVCRLKQALIKDKRFDNLFLLPTAQTKDKTAVTPEQMQKLVDDLKKEFDYVIIDCPAGIEHGFENAVAGADRAIVVTTPEVSAVRDADRIIGKLEAKGLEDHQLIINRIKYEMTKKGEMLNIDDMTDILAIKLLGIIPEDEKIVISTNRGEPAVTDENSKAGRAYRNVARRIMGEDVPFIELEEEPTGFFASIKKLLFKK